MMQSHMQNSDKMANAMATAQEVQMNAEAPEPQSMTTVPYQMTEPGNPTEPDFRNPVQSEYEGREAWLALKEELLQQFIAEQSKTSARKTTRHCWLVSTRPLRT